MEIHPITVWDISFKTIYMSLVVVPQHSITTVHQIVKKYNRQDSCTWTRLFFFFLFPPQLSFVPATHFMKWMNHREVVKVDGDSHKILSIGFTLIKVRERSWFGLYLDKNPLVKYCQHLIFLYMHTNFSIFNSWPCIQIKCYQYFTVSRDIVFRVGGKVTGSPKSVGFINWSQGMSVHLLSIHQIVVDFGPNWNIWTTISVYTNDGLTLPSLKPSPSIT